MMHRQEHLTYPADIQDTDVNNVVGMIRARPNLRSLELNFENTGLKGMTQILAAISENQSDTTNIQDIRINEDQTRCDYIDRRSILFGASPCIGKRATRSLRDILSFETVERLELTSVAVGMECLKTIVNSKGPPLNLSLRNCGLDYNHRTWLAIRLIGEKVPRSQSYRETRSCGDLILFLVSLHSSLPCGENLPGYHQENGAKQIREKVSKVIRICNPRISHLDLRNNPLCCFNEQGGCGCKKCRGFDTDPKYVSYRLRRQYEDVLFDLALILNPNLKSLGLPCAINADFRSLAHNTTLRRLSLVMLCRPVLERLVSNITRSQYLSRVDITFIPGPFTADNLSVVKNVFSNPRLRSISISGIPSSDIAFDPAFYNNTTLEKLSLRKSSSNPEILMNDFIRITDEYFQGVSSADKGKMGAELDIFALYGTLEPISEHTRTLYPPIQVFAKLKTLTISCSNSFAGFIHPHLIAQLSLALASKNCVMEKLDIRGWMTVGSFLYLTSALSLNRSVSTFGIPLYLPRLPAVAGVRGEWDLSTVCQRLRNVLNTNHCMEDITLYGSLCDSEGFRDLLDRNIHNNKLRRVFLFDILFESLYGELRETKI